MRYENSLQIKLQERYRRLYKCNHTLYDDEAGYLVSFIKETPALNSIIDELSRFDLDVEEWVGTHLGRRQQKLPPSEIGRAKLSWHLLNKWASTAQAASMFGSNFDFSASNMADGARVSTEQFVEPLIEYLQERLGDATDLLHLLERYVRRVEWFEKEALFERYSLDTKRGEASYDADLRRFLFEQGIDYPFSQPRSASGDADIVGDLESDDPLVCEIKLFNADSYGSTYLARGFNQAVQYANDYRKNTAYLVIFNVSDTQLELPTDATSGEWPPRIEHQGVTTYLVVIRAKPMPSASKQKKPATVVVSRDDLVAHSDAHG